MLIIITPISYLSMFCYKYDRRCKRIKEFTVGFGKYCGVYVPVELLRFTYVSRQYRACRVFGIRPDFCTGCCFTVLSQFYIVPDNTFCGNFTSLTDSTVRVNNTSFDDGFFFHAAIAPDHGILEIVSRLM